MPSIMHSNKRPTFGSCSLKTLSAAVASALLFSNAYAAGLGKLTVLSFLGQPLRAEIELSSVSSNEVGALNAKLASSEAFRQANIDFNSALLSLRFAIEQRGERQFVRVTSVQPLNEPFVDMLLELSGPNGRLIREYTFLLDPADLRTSQAVQVAPVRAPQASVSTPLPVQSAPAPQATPLAAPPQPATPRAAKPVPQSPATAKADAQPGEYLVRSGDTLAGIAGRIKPGGVSLDQMLVALYQANPGAFIANNMNRLMAGKVLSVPSAETARNIDGAEARGMIVAQAADFNVYRNKLAGHVLADAAQKSAESSQTAGGKITAKVEEKATPASESKDKLKLSNALPAPGAGTAEDRIAAEKAIAEANARVKELEKNVNELQDLLEIKNKSLAELQKQAAAPATATPAPVIDAAPDKPAEAQTEKPAAAPPAPAPAATKPKPVAPSPPPETSLIDELLESPLTLPGIGAFLVALGALGIYRARRQKQSKPFDDSIISDSSLKANSLFGSTGGQSVDTNNSMFNSSFSPSASQLDTNEVDPVAEADVYIAYGRDAQAEEILKEALRTQPERHAVRVKLLEIYSNRKDLRAFEVLATELYSLTKGVGNDWMQAATLGVAIDPNNPLYASGKVDEEGAPGVLVAPTQPLDEHGLATLLSATQSDTSSLETISSLETDTSYFNNTAMATEKPVEPVPEPEAEVPKASSNELDFDLEGMGLNDMAVPNTIPRPVPAEPSSALASIDFDFLDEPKAATEEPAVKESAPEPQPEHKSEPASEPQAETIPPITDLEFHLKEETPAEEPPVANISLDMDMPSAESADIPALEINIPGLGGEQAPLEVKAEAAADPLNFDLSDISLELNPAGSNTKADLPAEPMLDMEQDLTLDTVMSDDASSPNAEMATKLDLAIAYQEIGDKEGARELLDEVLKGGTSEQSEKAKSLLLELA